MMETQIKRNNGIYCWQFKVQNIGIEILPANLEEKRF